LGKETLPYRTVRRWLGEETLPYRTVRRWLGEGTLPYRTVRRWLGEGTLPYRTVRRWLGKETLPYRPKYQHFSKKRCFGRIDSGEMGQQIKTMLYSILKMETEIIDNRVNEQ